MRATVSVGYRNQKNPALEGPGDNFGGMTFEGQSIAYTVTQIENESYEPGVACSGGRNMYWLRPG